MADNQKKYTAFFCYRRYNKDDGYADARLAASVNTAAYIFGHWENLRRDLPRGEKLGDALFEEQCSSVCYAELDNIFESIEYFFVFICPGFFDRILSDFSACGGSYEDMRAYATEHGNIPYLEIDKALDSGRCRICPVFIDCGDDHVNDYLTSNESTLARAFGGRERWNRLVHITNPPRFTYWDRDPGYNRLPCAYYDSMAGFFGAAPTQKAGGTQSAREIMNSCWSGVQSIQSHFLTSDETMNAAIILNTEKNETDWNAYNRFRNKNPDIYYIPEGYIDGVKAEYTTGDEKSIYSGKGFSEVKSKCGLFIGEEPGKHSPYVYYPIDWCQINDSSKRTDISICAICFGALMLNHYRDIDRGFLEKNELSIDDAMNDTEIQEKINGAMNLLLTLRDYEKFCWMSGWNFEYGTSGTINQTTLSISTLLGCGFLKNNFAAPEGWEREEQCFCRFLYIKDSMHWLGDLSINANQPLGGRYWASESTGGARPMPNTTLTVFCFESFMKYARTLAELINTKKDAREEHIKEWMSEFEYAREKLEGALKFLCSRYSNPISDEDMQKFCDRIMVLRAVTQYYIHRGSIYGCCGKEHRSPYLTEEALDLIRKNSPLVYSKTDDYILGCEPKENLPVIPVGNNLYKTTESYEHCGNLLYIDTLIKIASTVDDCKIYDVSPIDMRDKAVNLLKKYCDTDKEYDRIAGVGAGGERHYPIYSAYYYRMAVSDCQKYFGDDTKSNRAAQKGRI